MSIPMVSSDVAEVDGLAVGLDLQAAVGPEDLDDCSPCDVDLDAEVLDQHVAPIAVALDTRVELGELDRRLDVVERGLGVVEEQRRVALQRLGLVAG